MKYLSKQQILSVENKAIKRNGIPEIVLMENAGRQIYENIITSSYSKKRIAVICGTGNNGGDGLVAARFFSSRKPDVIIVGDPARLSKCSEINYKTLKKIGIKITHINTHKDLIAFSKYVNKADVIIDALFGIGLNRPVDGFYKRIIETMNDTKAKVIAVDIPSGLNADTGAIMGTCIKADMTVTFHSAKKGMIRGDGPKMTGELIVADIGIR